MVQFGLLDGIGAEDQDDLIREIGVVLQAGADVSGGQAGGRQIEQTLIQVQGKTLAQGERPPLTADVPWLTTEVQPSGKRLAAFLGIIAGKRQCALQPSGMYLDARQYAVQTMGAGEQFFSLG